MERTDIRKIIMYLALSFTSFLGICHLTVTGLMFFWAEPMDDYMNLLGSVPFVDYLFLGFFLWLLLISYILINCTLIIGLVGSLNIIKENVKPR